MTSSLPPSPRSLKRKLFYPLAAASLALAALSLLGIYLKAQQQIERSLRIRSELVADMVSHANQSVTTQVELQRIVTAIGPEQEVSLILVVGGTPPHVVASSREEWLGAPLSALPRKDVGEDIERAIRTGQSHHDLQPDSFAFDFTSPLHPDPDSHRGVEGAVMVHLDVRPTQNTIVSSSIQLGAFALIGGLLLTLFGFSLLNRMVLAPLDKIGSRLSERRQGRLEPWPEGEGDDEIAVLARALQGALRDTDAALEELDSQTASLVISEERWRLVLRGSTDAAWDWNLDTGEVFYSTRWLEMLGFSPSEVKQDPELQFLLAHPSDVERMRQTIADALAGDATTYELEGRLLHQEGHYVPILSRGVILRDDEGNALRISGTNMDLTERKAVERALREQAIERARKLQIEGLLREIHHRVKNNLQMISSLLHFQIKKSPSSEVATVFREAQDRLRAMTLVHDQLHRSKDVRSVALDAFLESLCRQLRQSFGSVTARVRLELETTPLAVPSEIAVPCGMVVTELVMNAFKYAFGADQTGTVRVELAREAGDVKLSVKDDGVGLPAEVDLSRPRSFGLELVTNLADQLGARICRTPGSGTSITISFPLPVASAVTEEESNE